MSAGEVVLAGQVLDADNRPLPNADLTLVGWPLLKNAGQDTVNEHTQDVLATGKADAQGNFRLTVPRKQLAGHNPLSLLTAGGGRGLTWQTVYPQGNQSGLRLRLEKGRALRGRLVDSQGAPARGVRVQVAGLFKQGITGMRFPVPPERLKSWPAPATTDDQGNFEIPGVVPKWEVDLLIRDPRFAPQWFVLPPTWAEASRPPTLTLAPRRVLEGRLVCRDTGKPLAGAQVMVSTAWARGSDLISEVEGKTDERGRFRVTPFPGKSLRVNIYPPVGTPYLVLGYSLDWPAKVPGQHLNLVVPRGVLLRGKVAEAESGRPVAGARVAYQPRSGNPYLGRRPSGASVPFWKLAALSGSDGTFQLAVLPGPGNLLVKVPEPDYLHVAITENQLRTGRAGGKVLFPDAYLSLDLPEETAVKEVNLPVRRGVTVTGRILGQDDKPVPQALLLSPTYLGGPLGYDHQGSLLGVKDGKFTLPGLEPGTTTRVLITDPWRRQGAMAEIAGKADGKEQVVRLEPCGSAVVRFVDPQGKPLEFRNGQGKPAAPREVMLRLVLRPGASDREAVAHNVPARVAIIAGPRMGNFLVPAGRPGTFWIPNLVPGASYVLQVLEGYQERDKRSFTVAPGQRLVLPDIVMGRPNFKPAP